MASTFILGWCACREEGGVILLTTACPDTLDLDIPVLQSITSRRNIGQSFALGLADWRGIADPLPLACLLKGKWQSACCRLATHAAVMQLLLTCRGQTGQDGAGPSAAAVVPAAPIADCMAATTISPHLSPSHLQHPWLDPQGWWGEGEGLLWMKGERDKRLQIQISEEEDGLQCGDEQSQIPGLKSDSFLLKKVSNVQHCSNYSDRNLVKQKWWEKPGGTRPEGGTNSLNLLGKAWLAASLLGPR